MWGVGEDRKKRTHSFPYLPLIHILAIYYRNKTKLAGQWIYSIEQKLTSTNVQATNT